MAMTTPDPAMGEGAQQVAKAWLDRWNLRYPHDPAECHLASIIAAFAVEVAEEQTRELKQWVDDLQSGMYVNCVYCGHRYGPGETTPVTMADALKAHVEQCLSHPMSALKAREARLREALDFIARGYTLPGFKGESRDPLLALAQEVIHGAQATARAALAEAAG